MGVEIMELYEIESFHGGERMGRKTNWGVGGLEGFIALGAACGGEGPA